MSRILLVEDSQDLADGLINNLEMEGHEVTHVARGDEAVEAFRASRPQLVVLDMMLPVMDGFSVLERIRANDSDTPVLCLTARGAEVDKVRALRSGADDYVTKPFGLMELLARVEALLRRFTPKTVKVIELGEVSIDVPDRTVLHHGKPVALSPKEFDLLLTLAMRPNEVISRQRLMKEVWGHGGRVVSRTVDTHVATLRSKLEEDPAHPKLIVTSWKAGYKLVRPE
ncbi:MAG: response regulator transcription factor [Candidatus Wenzhouxiangella sp. M2_3B_020]